MGPVYFEHGGREPLNYSLDFVRRTGGEYLSLLELRSAHDAEVARICFANGEPFGQVCERLGIRLGRELNMTDDAWRFTPTNQVLPGGEDPRDSAVAAALREQGYLVLQEGKHFHQFDDLWDERPKYLLSFEKLSSAQHLLPANTTYRISQRGVSSSTNERTSIFHLLPPGRITGHNNPTERTPYESTNIDRLHLLGEVNTFAFDFVTRLKVNVYLSMFILQSIPFATTTRSRAMLSHSALRLTCNHAGYAALWREQVGEAWREERAAFDWPVLKDNDARWAVRAAIDAVVADAYGLSRAQYAHVLSTFSHKSYPKAPGLCLTAFDELKELGLEAFTQKHDPYGDIPLNEALPEPQVSGFRGQGSGVRGQGAEVRDEGPEGIVAGATQAHRGRKLKPDTRHLTPIQQVIDFAAAAAARQPKAKKAADETAGYQVSGARFQVSGAGSQVSGEEEHAATEGSEGSESDT